MTTNSGTLRFNATTGTGITFIGDSTFATGGQVFVSADNDKTAEVPGQMTFDEVAPMEFIDAEGKVWEGCCEHCGCDSEIDENGNETGRTGHDDTCSGGCND